MGWLRTAAVWSGVALLFGANSYASRLLSARPVPLLPVLAYSWMSWIFFAIATGPIAALVRAFPAQGRRWRRSAPAIAAGGAAVLAAMAAWDTAMVKLAERLFDTSEILGSLAALPLPRLYEEVFIRYAAVTLLAYAATVTALQAIGFRRTLQERELRASQLEAQLAEARLAALKAQLQPHFLFNTLNSIAALVHADPEAAERMIVLLSDLLRTTLASTGEQEIPLRRELEVLERYLEIERMRFPDRLGVLVEPGEGTLDALVPNLILQPLVENAIRHGIAPRLAPGTVTVRSRRAGEALEVEVADDGVGLGASRDADGRPAVGLANTRERLRQLYGDAAALDLAANPGGGLAARLRLPFKPSAGEGGRP
jgi:hypothetical protein